MGHAGFLSNYRRLAGGLIQGIWQALRAHPSIRRLTVQGFSMGGALSQLAIVDLSRKFPQLCGSIVTFGSPRVGNKDFARKLFPRSVCGTSRRFTHRGDMVVHMPPKFLGYRHVAFETWNPDVSKGASEFALVSNCDTDRALGGDNRCSNAWGRRNFLPDHVEYLGVEFDKRRGCEIANPAALINRHCDGNT